MIGTAYFLDGHTEEITEATIMNLDFGCERIEFFTESGRYFYQSWYEFQETLWCDPKPAVNGNFRYKFYRLDYDQVRYLFEDYDGVSPIIVDVPIVSIELNTLKMKEKEKEND